jgi:DNA-binding NtrC family response regulator
LRRSGAAAVFPSAPQRHALSGFVPASILVVDDDCAFPELVCSELEQLGHQVRVAHSVIDAQRVVRAASSVDLISSDIRMPGGLGFELLWCEGDDAARIPGVMMSSFPTDELREFTETTGAAFLAKPFCLEQLHSTIHALLHKQVGTAFAFCW